ncbi:MAG: DUF4250 domain-containing protein [Odoribacter sp.]|nr:DUF4250 domain-containing protein [Odoribacter sp.]
MSEFIPQDPYMLLSFINMKLRDHYTSLAELCEDLGIDCDELQQKLSTSGFEYLPESNRFA